MKVMTILGTRPEIIRLSRVIPKLDVFADHVLVHTGQNFDDRLSDIFFSELAVRTPNFHLDTRANSAMGQIGRIIEGVDKLFAEVKPDRVLILGDTNSALCSIPAKRRGIKVFHMEAGNRCYDDRVPEEVNRRIVDHSSDVLLPYTQRSRENLLREGCANNRVYVTGNPIYEVMEYYRSNWISSTILKQLDIKPREYFLVTLHRAENVDDPIRLEKFLTALSRLASEYSLPVICSVHPRTRSQLEKQGKQIDHQKILAIDPVGFFDFLRLESEACCVLSDSGTVQEECSIMRVPNVTLRDVTERPETLEVGSNYLTGCEVDSILAAVRAAVSMERSWTAPLEYQCTNVSDTVVRIILSHWM
ncbi:non-hydrolyzing UDP-N-acetylglucosamine 2-epimerase [Methylocaldum sp. BRCS4]|jgi:UDP-N-acetylglucosamine 2-epimerase (non-hydrolysing)|uniref:non-hydrolyzing UDP-N-acetylglucosamine 2-epimerase n=1 Tax=Methylocaldum sp. GT1TLB TaxID=3438965 RepID=UPI0012EBBCCB|nr:UDP-N-acetylglucosamine 2-epimerase (non-hydrolyzing) [Methylocaldum sp. BRCS4]